MSYYPSIKEVKQEDKGFRNFGIRIDVQDIDNNLSKKLNASILTQDLKGKELKIKKNKQLLSESYIIEIEDKITLEYKDEKSLFYGLDALNDIFKDDYVYYQRIFDEPSYALRGIVEGFYGEPWTHQERLDHLSLCGKYRINAYIYAPKDDAYHREKWRELYPDSKLRQFKDLIETAKLNHVELIYAIAPGLDLDFSNKDFESLMKKLSHLYDQGVRSFALLYDDIENKDGKAQAKFINRVYLSLKKSYSDIKNFITVPTEYDFATMNLRNGLNDYTKEFSQYLHEDIIVLWTGKNVVSQDMSHDDIQKMHNIYPQPLAVWWNYPVTDYNKEKIALGPIVDLPLQKENLKGFFFNPMEHAELSKISLATSADYSWNPSSYQPLLSWRNAIKSLYPDIYQSLYYLAEHSSQINATWTVGLADGFRIKVYIEKYWEATDRLDSKNLLYYKNILQKEFDDIFYHMTCLLERKDKKVVQESYQHIIALKDLSVYAQKALLLQDKKREQENHQTLLQEIRNFLKKKPDVLISEHCIYRFIEDCSQFNFNPVHELALNQTILAVNDKLVLRNPQLKAFESIIWSINGKQYKQAEVVHKIKKEGTIDIVQTIKSEYKKSIKEFNSYVVVDNYLKEANQNILKYGEIFSKDFANQNEKAENLRTLNPRTKWCAVKKDSYELRVKFDRSTLVNGLNLYHAEYGGEPAGMNTDSYRVTMIDSNHSVEEILSVKGNTKSITKHTFKPRKVEEIVITILKGSGGSENTARLYGMEVLGVV